jgi:hypothetical protein
MENFKLNELEPVGSIVYTLKVADKSNENRRITFALTGDTFSVDEDTGEVRLVKKLDRERQPIISTVINVLSSNSEEPIESRRRTIVVEDADDSWPIFAPHKSSLVNNPDKGQYVYQAEVSERAPVGSVVLAELQVTDADEGPNAEVVFECRKRQSTNRACEIFSIETRQLQTGRYSVTIRTKQMLDYEREQSFRLSLIARGAKPAPLRKVPLEAEAVVNIEVLNVQDEGPAFVNAPYSLSLPEGLEANSRQLKLIVQDGDLAPQRDLSVIVADGPFKKYFSVTKDPKASKVWYLETNATLDREDPKISNSNNMFTIHLIAMELDEFGVPIAKAAELHAAISGSANYNRALIKRESVTVMVLDQPDSVPMFVQTSSGKLLDRGQLVVVNVSEALTTGTSVPNLDLTAMDIDQGSNSRFRLALVDGPVGPRASDAFALETELVHGRTEIVLNVLNSSLLDYEDPRQRVFRFRIEANKMLGEGGGGLTAQLEMQINLVDSNDNWPEFERDQYIVSVQEGSPPGHVVATIRATDRDSGPFGHVGHILIGHGASKFKVISDEGKILVGDCALVQCLDYEIQTSYSLIYVARDGGGHTRNVSVIINVIDINDHAPRFSEPIYKRELISDNLSSKQNYISPQLIVRARDDDGPQHGRNNITYRIKSSNLTGLDVEPSSGLVYLAQPLDLDRIIESHYHHQSAPWAAGFPGAASSFVAASHNRRKIVFEAEVVADDNGSPPMNSSAIILLVVRGNRDGAPKFKQDLYLAYVPENQPPAKPFFQVQAVDPDEKDSQLRYSLGYDLNDLISIDEQTGQLAFKTSVSYEEFKGLAYNVTVYATDNSRPYPLRASAVVSVLVQDVNNKAPKFNERDYKAMLVQGKTRPGDVVLQVAANDSDLNAHLNYSLLIDRIQVNDRNGQRFSLDDLANSTWGYLAQMNQSERVGLVNELRRLFAINQRTGAVELKREPDYSFASSILVPVRVVDTNQEIFTQTGELQEDFVQCNFFLQTHIDKRPQFAPPWSYERRNYSVSILEELPLETPIFALLARDPQTNQNIDLYERIYESDPRDYFRVDRSGQILINRRLDYEELPAPKRLHLAVKAINSEGLFSVANINIQLLDLNDNAPQFRNQTYRVSVSESIASNQEILTVSADDRDSNEYNQVYYSLAGYSGNLFQIHPRKGVISLRKNAKLDRDTEARHRLVVTASDCNETKLEPHAFVGGSTIDSLAGAGASAASAPAGSVASCKRSSVPVEITVLDENDNDPTFVSLNRRGEFEATVSETVSVGSVITQVVAKDIDEGANGMVGYEIVRNDEQFSKLFKIDSEGYISAVGSLSGLGRSTPYKLTIRAYDMGPKQSRDSYATLALTISDVVQNDGVPKFLRPKPDEVVTLPESAGPSTFLYQVQAVDPDEEANGKLMYKFTQPSDMFEIDPFEGVIKTHHRPGFYLDRELVPNYTLIIVAQDLGSPPKQAYQVLIVRISDINDNEPYFEREIDDPPLVLYAMEELPKDSLIGTIQAVDKDIGQNALIGYEIIEGNQQNLFRLSWEPVPLVGIGGADSSPPSPRFNQVNTINTLGPDQSQPVQGNNPCRIYSTGRLDRDSRDSYTLTIKATSMSKMRNQLLNLRDPLGGRSPFNQYNASDLTKIRVTIKLLDVNDNRPVFVQPNPKSVVDSSAEVYSQLMVIKAIDVDSSSAEMQYSILDAVYYSDSKLNKPADNGAAANSYHELSPYASMKYVFDIHPSTGILRNAVSLRPFTDGYFEVFVKADSSGQSSTSSSSGGQQSAAANGNLGPAFARSAAANDNQSVSIDSKCADPATNSSNTLPPGVDATENCFVAVTKAVVFVTHQRETFRFVFNKTKLNDRLEEFKRSLQQALEDIMFEPGQVQASTADQSMATGQHDDLQSSPTVRAEKVYLNTFNTDFYEREDGSLDFSTITSCSQLVKFDDRTGSYSASRQYPDHDTLVPNQVVSYEDVVSLLKTLNTTQSIASRQQPSQQQPMQQPKPTLFSQYGLVKVERCLPDKTMYKMTISERLALYFAATIALVSILLAFVVSRMRKNYEKNLKILQRSKYQYMGSPYA